jgi:D-amino-acid oxidase
MVPPDVRTWRQPSVEDLEGLIINEGVGLRPGRKEGRRIELEWRSTGTIKVPVIHNYG